MATIEEMTQNVWFERFLNQHNLSRADFNQLEDKSSLQNDFESFIIEKFNNPLISTPEEEDKSQSPEVIERYAQADKLPHKPEGYHISDNLDYVAYQRAVLSLAMSGEDITEANLQSHIAQQSNNVAVEYYSGLYGLCADPKAQEKSSDDKQIGRIAAIDEMVRKNLPAEKIYASVFGNAYAPDKGQEQVVQAQTISSNRAAAGQYLGHISEGLKKLNAQVDVVENFNKKYPLVQMVSSVALRALGAGALYRAARMSMAARTLLKESRANNKSLKEMFRDRNKNPQIKAAFRSFARAIPVVGTVVGIKTMTEQFGKEQREAKKKNFQGIINGFKNGYKEFKNGNRKEGLKAIGKSAAQSAAVFAGAAMTVYAAYKGYEYFSGDSADAGGIDSADSAQSVASDANAPAEIDSPVEQNVQDNVNTTAAATAAPIEHDAQQFTPEQQHDIEMLFKRNPEAANQMLGDGKWHSSAELAQMWQDGRISDDMKTQMADFAGARFDDAGNFVDADGKLDVQMENAAQEWQQSQTPEAEPALHSEADTVESQPEDKVVAEEKSADNAELPQTYTTKNGDEINYAINSDGKYTSMAINGQECPPEKLQELNSNEQLIEHNKEVYNDNSNQETAAAAEKHVDTPENNQSQDAANETQNKEKSLEAAIDSTIEHTTKKGNIHYSIQPTENGYDLHHEGSPSTSMHNHMYNNFSWGKGNDIRMGDNLITGGISENMNKRRLTNFLNDLNLKGEIADDIYDRQNSGETITDAEQHFLKDLKVVEEKYGIRRKENGEREYGLYMPPCRRSEQETLSSTRLGIMRLYAHYRDGGTWQYPSDTQDTPKRGLLNILRRHKER